MSKESVKQERSQIQLSEWFEDENLNEKFQKFINQIEVSDSVSQIADELKPVILQDVNKKIDRQTLKVRIYKYSAYAAACISLLIVSSLFLRNKIDVQVDKDQLMANMESLKIEDGEIYILSGNTQKTVDNENPITQTKEGKILIGSDQEIGAEDIKSEYITVMVPKGRRTNILFNDGTRIWINSGTKIIYPKIFDVKSRNILVDGEIFLDVAKDEKRPFIVHTKKMDIQVTGTQFNVNAYSSENSNSVVLKEGSVEVITGSKRNKLSPEQGLINENGNIHVKHVDIYSYICWIDGRLQLEGESFDVLLRKLSRYYGIRIESDPALYHYKFEGYLNLQDSLEDILNILSVSKPFMVEKREDGIYLSQRKNIK